MKKKFLFLSALVAATTAFISCSSDENLAEVPEVIEEPAPEPEPQGTPITVMLNNGGTRADLTTTVADLQSFKLWGIHNGNRQIDGAVFTGDNTAGWTATGAMWPTTDKSTPTSFYGYADYSDLTSAEPTGLTDVSILPAGQSFHYSFGDGESSTLAGTSYTYEQLDEIGLGEMYAAYQSTADKVIKIEDETTMPDLLVTADGLKATEYTNSGKLDVTLKHALSNLSIKARFTTSAPGGGTSWISGMTFHLVWLRVHGLYTAGTYTFGGTPVWSSNSDTDDKVVYEKVWGLDNPLEVAIQEYSTVASNGYTYTPLISAGEFMVIPQEFTSWTPASGELGNCYIECFGYITAGEDEKVQDNQILHFPLAITNNTFVAGRKHVMAVDLTEARDASGTYVADPATVGGSAPAFVFDEDLDK